MTLKIAVVGNGYVDAPEAVAERADAVVLLTEWPEYLGLDLAGCGPG